MVNDTIICKNCRNSLTEKYCNQFRKKLYHEKGRKITYLFQEVFHFITHFEGVFFATPKTIFTAPGQLLKDYCDGIHKRYFTPLLLFLLPVVLYLLFSLAEGLDNDMYTFTGKFITAVCTAMAMKKIYDFRRLVGIGAAFVFIYFHGLIVNALYKFTLFVAVFYQIH